MQNITLTQIGTKLTIEVDLSQDFGPSKSGKTIIIATTGGNVPAPNDPRVKIGVNVYKGR